MSRNRMAPPLLAVSWLQCSSWQRSSPADAAEPARRTPSGTQGGSGPPAGSGRSPIAEPKDQLALSHLRHNLLGVCPTIR